MPTRQYMSNSRLRICANKTDIYYLIIIYITIYYGLWRCQLPMMAILPLFVFSTMKLISMQGKQNWKRKRRKRLYNGGGRRISGLVLVVTINTNSPFFFFEKTNSPYPLGQTNWKNKMTQILISYHPLLVTVVLLLYKIYYSLTVSLKV